MRGFRVHNLWWRKTKTGDNDSVSTASPPISPVPGGRGRKLSDGAESEESGQGKQERPGSGKRGAKGSAEIEEITEEPDQDYLAGDEAVTTPSRTAQSRGSTRSSRPRSRNLGHDKYAGIVRRMVKGEPLIETGTHGPARGALTNLTMHEVYTMFDEDRDGWITEQQLEKAFTSVGISLRATERKELMREVEEELELWTDSEDSMTPSEASVSSDDSGPETVYEDHEGNIKVLQNIPRTAHKYLGISESGNAKWKYFEPGGNKLDRDRPDQIEAWASCTSDPGLPLKDTLKRIRSRTNFLRSVARLQSLHERVKLDGTRQKFQEAWNDRSLDKSEAEDRLRAWLKKAGTWQYWRDLFGARVKQLIDLELEERTRRRNNALKVSSIAIKPRPVLQRVTNVFAEVLVELDEDEREQVYRKAWSKFHAEDEEIDIRSVMRVMREFGASVNTTEIIEMMESVMELGDEDNITAESSCDLATFSKVAEWLFLAVIAAGKIDRIVVSVLEASELPVMDRFGSADPFVTAELVDHDEDKRMKTSVKKHNMNPAWNEDLRLLEASEGDIVLVSCWDHEESGFGSNLIGEFSVEADDILTEGEKVNQTTTMLDKWFDLHSHQGNIIKGKYGGVSKIHCRISYIRGALTELKRKPVGLDADFHIVTLRVIMADHLPKMDKQDDGSVDPYCIVMLGDQKFRTTTCQQTYEPVWDVTYQLIVNDLAAEILVSMYDWDDDGKDDIIGTAKVFPSLLNGNPQVDWYDLRSAEENSFIIGVDGERAGISMEASIITADDLKESKSPMEILFLGLGSDDRPTVLAASSALWQILSADDDYSEREALSILDKWQTMSDILITGVLEIQLYNAKDLPRMDYFGLCDPYVVVEMDGYSVKSDTVYKILDPEWNATLQLPVFRLPPETLRETDKPITFYVYDWDKVGDHDLIGIVEVPFKKWDFGGPEEESFIIRGPLEKLQALRAGEPDQVVRRPIIGHSGKESKLNAKITYKPRVVVDDDCQEEIAWSIAFACINHTSNARSFGDALGGVSGLVAMLKKPIVEEAQGVFQQAAAYALGNLAAAHHPLQETIKDVGGVEALLNLVQAKNPCHLVRAVCLSLASVIADNPVMVQYMLYNCGKGDKSKRDTKDDLVYRCGGIGTLLTAIRDIKPDAAQMQKKGGDEAWAEVGEACEAAVQAVSAASFIAPGGIFSEGQRTVEKVAVAVGRQGIAVLRDLAHTDPKVGHAKKCSPQARRYARLCYEGLEAAFGMA